MAERKNLLLRLDPAVHDALARWAADELRSTTAQIEFVLRQALSQAGRLPGNVGGLPRRGRPPKAAAQAPADGPGPDSGADDRTDPEAQPRAQARSETQSEAEPEPEPDRGL